MLLAHELTELVHGKEEADKAEATAKALFAGGGDDANMPTTTIAASDVPAEGISVIDLLSLCQLIPSRGEGRRLIEQGGVSIDGEKVTAFDQKVSVDALKEGVKIKKGKKIFHKAIIG